MRGPGRLGRADDVVLGEQLGAAARPHRPDDCRPARRRGHMGLLVMVNAAGSRSPAEAPVGLVRISDEVAVELMLSREPTTEMPAADGAVTLIVVVAGALDAPAFDAVSDAVYRALERRHPDGPSLLPERATERR